MSEILEKTKNKTFLSQSSQKKKLSEILAKQLFLKDLFQYLEMLSVYDIWPSMKGLQGGKGSWVEAGAFLIETKSGFRGKSSSEVFTLLKDLS